MFNEINYNDTYDVLGLYEAIYAYQGNNRKALYNSLQLTSLTNEYKKILWRMNSNMVFGKINNLTFSWYLAEDLYQSEENLLSSFYNKQNVTYYWLAF